MKKQLLLLVGLLVICSSTFAQSIKYGSVNSAELVEIMPERDSALVKLQAYGGKLNKEMQDMQAEYAGRIETYQKNSETYSAVMRKQKEEEIQEAQGSIQQFQQLAQAELQEKQAEFMQPVIDKMNAAIKKVSETKGISFVIDMATPPFLYINPKVVTDIMDEVKEELSL